MAINISIIIFLIGLYGLVFKKNLIKKVMGLSILNSGIVLFFVSIGYKKDATAPIMQEGITKVADPLPQALMLTTIVIGICVTAFALSLIVKIYERYKTLNVQQLIKEEDE
ncbi:cation:proton antiporter [Candidatus Desantisbacteria bacterium CG_4_10_14_0_8_um_filter_39_17]|uniref:Cation:proton antiporter n=1 Tax=Candidatus Desantisbacteria bacterium CG_4_10_14_0_8_um_filter_39_17 TaxID=1974542 RepID=A0A2H9PED0_9BACT|nr:MAG: cation:proton antiporter [Candidatus Desantisbacteria bacterium CG_4_10_14_0_8_um_filter_39_17]